MTFVVAEFDIGDDHTSYLITRERTATSEFIYALRVTLRIVQSPISCAIMRYSRPFELLLKSSMLQSTIHSVPVLYLLSAILTQCSRSVLMFAR